MTFETFDDALIEAVNQLAEEGGGEVFIHKADCSARDDMTECECEPAVVFVLEPPTLPS